MLQLTCATLIASNNCELQFITFDSNNIFALGSATWPVVGPNQQRAAKNKQEYAIKMLLAR